VTEAQNAAPKRTPRNTRNAAAEVNAENLVKKTPRRER